MPNTYDKGDLVRITGTWTNAASAAVDPDVIKASHLDPSGNQTDLTINTGITKDSTGVYYFDLGLDEAGTWMYRFYGESSGGTEQGAEENYIHVESNF